MVLSAQGILKSGLHFVFNFNNARFLAVLSVRPTGVVLLSVSAVDVARLKNNKFAFSTSLVRTEGRGVMVTSSGIVI